MFIENFKTVDVISERQRRRAEAYFQHIRRAELGYSLQLRKIARHVGDLIKHFDVLKPNELAELTTILNQYATILEPWAVKVAQRMIFEVIKRDEQAWNKASKKIGVTLKKEIQETPLGDVIRKILDDQVHLIKSLPIDAGRRVQKLALQYHQEGKRYSELIPMIMDSGNVTLNRATLIARTETAKASSAITQARAKSVGSNQYIWHSVQDPFVRPMHKKLNGRAFKWDDPPIAEENGTRHHPGEFPNCRCFAEPLLPEIIQ